MRPPCSAHQAVRQQHRDREEEVDHDEKQRGTPDSLLELRHGPAMERPEKPRGDGGIGDELADGRPRVEPADGGSRTEAEGRGAVVPPGRGDSREDGKGDQNGADVVGAQSHRSAH
jgi:hypothetical protein